MAWETGTASNHNDLMVKLDTFLISNAALVAAGDNWTQIYDGLRAATPTEPSRLFKVWTAPGSSGLNEIYFGGYTQGIIATDLYNLAFAGGTYFNAGAAEDPAAGNPVRSGLQGRSKFVTLFGDQNPIRYWFVANNRRVVVIVQIGTVYAALYGGLILALARPDEYPYPMVVAGNYRDPDESLVRYSDQSGGHGSLADPRNQSCWLIHPDQGWRDYYGAAVDGSYVANASQRGISPTACGRFNSDGEVVLNQWLPVDSAYALSPLEFCTTENTGAGIWGRYDGVFYVTGAGLTAEDVITISGTDYLVVPGGFRNGVRNFMAVELS